MARNHTLLTATDMVTLRSLFCLGTIINQMKTPNTPFLPFSKVRGTAGPQWAETSIVFPVLIVNK